MRDVDGDTPLHLAVVKGNLAAVQLLLTKGAISTINTRNNNGQVPLHIAAKHGLADIAQVLLSNGARTSLKDKDDLTALSLAKKGRHERCARYLEKHIEKCVHAKAVKVKVPRKRGWFG
ncbi:ankyrin repeat-containing domain protein [Halenospora varia]|nr:ankyrin repeat-containing domain protein [Halenospora varia]